MTQTWFVPKLLLSALSLTATALLVSACSAEPPQKDREALREPVYRVASTSGEEKKEDEHPLAPGLRMAEAILVHINKDIKDYSATMVKRERINGKLRDPEYIFLKARNEKVEDGRVVTPFSVYMYFMGPDAVKGRQVLYVKGHNEGKLIAREGKGIKSIVTVSLAPDSNLAMADNRYPITEIGLTRLVEKLIEVAKDDMKFGECEVKFFKKAKISGRECTLLQVVHPVPRSSFKFHMAKIYIDDELSVPIRYEAYDWPEKAGAAPPLMEEYTYLNLKVNIGLTDADFTRENKEYSFNK